MFPWETGDDNFTNYNFSTGGFGFVGGDIYLGSGNDRATVGFETNYIDGGDGTDFIFYNWLDQAIWLNLNQSGVKTYTRGADNILFGDWEAMGQIAGFENVSDTRYADQIILDGQDNVLVALGSGDADSFYFGPNSAQYNFDRYDGGSGNDTLSLGSMGTSI